MLRWFSFKNPFFCLCVFVVAVFSVYGKTLNAPFHFDDLAFILDNPQVTDLRQTFGGLGDNTRKFFSLVTFALNYHFNGERAFWYHGINILLHLLTGIFLWRALLNLFKAPWFRATGFPSDPHIFSVWVTLLFLAHPLQTQSVSYIWERSEVLSGLFYAVILLCYWKGRAERNVRFIFYSGCFWIFGLFVKGTVLTAPFLIGVSEILFFDGAGVLSRLKFRHYVRIGYVSIMVFFLAHLVAGHVFSKGLGFHPRYLFTQFPIIWTYIRLTILPLGQSVDHSFRWCHNLWDPYFLLSGLVLCGLLAGLCLWAKRARLAAFGAFWYFIYLLPTSSVFSIGTPIFEHRLYFSIAGFAVFFMACLFGLFCNSHRRWRDGLAVILIVSLAFTAFFRNDVWLSRESLMKDTIRKNPKIARPYLTLGSYYLSENRLEEAQRMFQRAIDLAPSYAEAYNNLGIVFLRRGRPQEALKAFQESMHYKPKYVNAYLNAAELFERNGNIAVAWSYILGGLTLSDDERLFSKAGDLLFRLGDGARAQEYLNEGIRLHSRSALLYYSQGNLFFRMGKLEQAVRSYQQAIVLNPEYRDAFNDLGVVFFRLREFEKARDVLERAKELSPRNPGVYKNLANVYHELGDFKTAEDYFELSRTIQFRSNASMNLK